MTARLTNNSPAAIYAKPNGSSDGTKINAILASMGPGMLQLGNAFTSPYVIDQELVLQEGQRIVGMGKLATRVRGGE